jgi:fatty acid oxidation complex beta subunit FadI
VVVDGCRTPFLRSGADFVDLSAYDLGAMAVAGLLARSRVAPGDVERVVFGTVLQDPRTSNLAREVALGARLPESCPAFTVTAACISSNVAIASAASAIESGEVSLAIAGGAETLSDVPIRLKRPLRKRLLAARKTRGFFAKTRLFGGLGLSDLLPETPALAEFSTRQTMGQAAERLAKRLSISREEQDAYALSSHSKAARAVADGLLADEILPAVVPPRFTPIARDNGVRADTTLEKLARLPPAFDRRFGTVTAGNSSFLTDGAAACLLASEERAKELGLPALARVAASVLVAADPVEELLLGPAYAIPTALAKAGLTLPDVDVFEIHEAFASPVLAVLRLLADARFAKERLGASAPLGTIPGEKLNAWGGSLALGHPFGATGARLVTTACRRLEREGGRVALVASCAAGGLGHAMVLVR